MNVSIRKAMSLVAMPLVALASAGAASAQANEGNAQIVAVEAMLLYEQSGKMSFNLAGNDYFIAYNIPIGEGSAEENASDIMIRAVIKADEQVFAETPLVISVYDSEGNVLDRRTIEGILLEKSTYRSMLFEEGVCAGEITIEAKMGASVKRQNMNLMCGE